MQRHTPQEDFHAISFIDLALLEPRGPKRLNIEL